MVVPQLRGLDKSKCKPRITRIPQIKTDYITIICVIRGLHFTHMASTRTQRLTQILALNRTVAIVLLTVLLFGLGEELWSQFMPVYLNALQKDMVDEAGTAGTVTANVL